MKTPPSDFDERLLRQVLEIQWSMHVAELVYLPVGFGDHHWKVRDAEATCWFVTVRDLRLDGRGSNPDDAVSSLEQTYQAIRYLKRTGGLEFIVTAVPNRGGAMVHPLEGNFAVSVYEWLDLDMGWQSDGRTSADLVAQLHRSSRKHPVHAVREDFRIPHRSALDGALGDLHRAWSTGAYAEAAREQLVVHQTSVRLALERYDALAAFAGSSSKDWCLTHGEPSGGNVVQDHSGRTYVVDWESARIAPPERDLVELSSSPDALAHYQELTGSAPRLELLDLYKRWYALAQTAVYVRQFRAPHAADANMRESWRNFLTFLPGRALDE